jgi:hypothetical protein
MRKVDLFQRVRKVEVLAWNRSAIHLGSVLFVSCIGVEVMDVKVGVYFVVGWRIVERMQKALM